MWTVPRHDLLPWACVREDDRHPNPARLLGKVRLGPYILVSAGEAREVVEDRGRGRQTGRLVGQIHREGHLALAGGRPVAHLESVIIIYHYWSQLYNLIGLEYKRIRLEK